MAAYDEVIARNVRAHRSRIGIGQERLAARMRALGYTAFLRQTVSKVEKGERRLSATEVHGLAWALEVSMAQLLEPTPGDKTVEFPSGSYLGASSVAASVRGVNDGSIEWKGDVPVWIGVSYPPGQYPEVDAWRSAQENAPRAQHPIPMEEALEQPVATAIVTSELGVLVGRRNDGKPPWTFIAGEVDPGESPADAAVREVKEETGLRAEVGDVIGERVHPKTGRTMIYLAATPTHGTDIFVGDEDELAEVRWVSLAEADELMAAYGMFGPVHDFLAARLGEG